MIRENFGRFRGNNHIVGHYLSIRIKFNREVDLFSTFDWFYTRRNSDIRPVCVAMFDQDADKWHRYIADPTKATEHLYPFEHLHNGGVHTFASIENDDVLYKYIKFYNSNSSLMLGANYNLYTEKDEKKWMYRVLHADFCEIIKFNITRSMIHFYECCSRLFGRDMSSANDIHDHCEKNHEVLANIIKQFVSENDTLVNHIEICLSGSAYRIFKYVYDKVFGGDSRLHYEID